MTDRRQTTERGRPRPHIGVAILLAVALLAAACGGGSDSNESGEGERGTPTTDAGPPKAGGSIVYALSGETDGWDPSTSRWSPSGLVVANAIFDTLTRFNTDGEIEPYLAESVEPNDTYDEWTITVRPWCASSPIALR